MNNMKKVFLEIGNTFKRMPILIALVLLIIIAYGFVPNYASLYNIKTLFLQIADLLIISCGVTFTVLNGGLDFSATSVLALGSVFGSYIMVYSPLSSNPAISIPVAVLSMILFGVIVGMINGWAVSKRKMPSFIATFATQTGFSGVAVLLCSIINNTSSIGGLPEWFFVFGGEGKAFLVPIVMAFALWGICYFVSKKTLFGRKMYAVGTNQKAAAISGINTTKVIFMLFALSGLFAGISCVQQTARAQAGLAKLGDNQFISIMSAIIVGGTNPTGGFGGFLETLIGVIFIAMLKHVLTILGVNWYTIIIIQGAIMLLAVTMGSLVGRGSKKQNAAVVQN